MNFDLMQTVKIGKFNLPVWLLGVAGGVVVFGVLALVRGGGGSSGSVTYPQAQAPEEKTPQQQTGGGVDINAILEQVRAEQQGMASGLLDALSQVQRDTAQSIEQARRAQSENIASQQDAMRRLQDEFARQLSEQASMISASVSARASAPAPVVVVPTAPQAPQAPQAPAWAASVAPVAGNRWVTQYQQAQAIVSNLAASIPGDSVLSNVSRWLSGLAPVVQQVETQQGQQYTVVRGDTLGAIARRFGTSLPAILAKNPQITNANFIRVGQVIQL